MTCQQVFQPVETVAMKDVLGLSSGQRILVAATEMRRCTATADVDHSIVTMVTAHGSLSEDRAVGFAAGLEAQFIV
ncbi:protein of unknown function [Pararobbsia alpina]